MTAFGLLSRLLLIAATVTPVSACLFRVWVHQESVRLGYQLSVEERKGRQLEELVKQLELELAAERSPAHLMQLARSLSLRPPEPTQVVGKNATRLITAAPATPKHAAAPAKKGGHRG